MKFTAEQEQEAEYFAICLLMPKSKVTKYVEDHIENGMLDISKMAEYFNVAATVMEDRLRELGFIE